MGAKANLSNGSEVLGFGLDSVVIAHYVGGIAGGRTLDVSDFTEDIIKAGHIVIRSTTDGTVYKPMPVSGGSYGTLPTGFEYVGVVVNSVSKAQPVVGIMNSGEVNDAACPFEMPSAVRTAIKTAVPTLIFIHA